MNQTNIMLVGDWNARIGTQQILLEEGCVLAQNRESEDIVCNANGNKMLELCQEYGMTIINGCSKSDRRGHLTFVGRQGKSVIDYCAISGSWMEYFKDLKIGLKTFSDHLPLEIMVHLNSEQSVRDLALLPKLIWNPTSLTRYQSSLNEYSTRRDWNHLNLDDFAKAIQDIIVKSTPRTTYKKQQAWFDDACGKARKASFAWLKLFRRSRNTDIQDLYFQANKRYKELCRSRKWEYYNRVAGELSSSNSSTEFWSKVKKLNGADFRMGANFKPCILAQYFESLMTCQKAVVVAQIEPSLVINETLDGQICVEEIKTVLMKAKDKKAPGYDRIPYEFLKNASNLFLEKICTFFNVILNEERVPECFKQAIIFPILKKGDPENPENYRGISFLNTIAKLFVGVIMKRLEEFVRYHDILCEEQAGFRQGYSTVDHLFTLKNVVDIAIKSGRKLYAVFVDLKAAFDKVDRRALIYKLRLINLSAKLVNIIQELYTGTTSAVWNGHSLSNWFETSTGVRQGCVLSPLLFALFINDLVECLPGGFDIGNFKLRILLYADDIVFFAETTDMLQVMLNRISEYCKAWGLEVNTRKSKVLIFNKKGRKSKNEKWYLNNEVMEVVKEYKYLGVTLTSNWNMSKHLNEKLKRSINVMNATWGKLFKLKEVTHSVKYKVFISAVRSVMFYAAEVWGNEEHEEVEKLLRYFVKRYFFLPTNTPTYMIILETGLSPFFVDTLKIHFNYLLKVLNFPEHRLPYKTLRAVIEKNTGCHRRLHDLASFHGVSVDLLGDRSKLKEDLTTLLQKTDLWKREDFMEQARLSQTRFVYSALCPNLEEKNYFRDEFSRYQISTIFRARGELLQLNYQPYRSQERLECSLCNTGSREDVVHFVGKCPLLREIRRLIFGKNFFTLRETIELLNGKNWTELVEYCTQALKYRMDYMN